MRGISMPAALLVSCVAGNAMADQPNWASTGKGNLPFDAVVGGKEANGPPLFVCRADNGTGLTPGKIRPGFAGCNIAFGGAEVSVSAKYDVLTPAWQNAFGGSVPSGATSLGAQEAPPNQTAFGTALYFCRALYNGGLHPGKVRNGFAGCNIPWGGKEVSIPNYQVLVDLTPTLPVSTVTVSGGPLPADAIVAGYEVTGEKIYICQAPYNGGLQPGKTRTGFNGCNIPLGGKEITVKNYSVLVPYWSTFPTYSFPVGKEAGQNFFVCHASYQGGIHPGKKRTDFQQCHIGWGGKEILVSDFAVLSADLSMRLPTLP